MAGKTNLMRRANVPTDVHEIFQLFQQHNEAGNLSKATMVSYEWNCKHFLTFLDEQGIDNIQDVDSDTVDKFKLHLVKGDRFKKISATSRNTYLRNTRVFLYYAMGKNFMIPFKIKLFPTEEPIPETYNHEEIAKLIVPPDLKTCKYTEYRNWVFVNYMFDTGNRLRSVLNIKVKDIDFSNNSILLTTTKNREQQIVCLSKAMVGIIKEYLNTWSALTSNSYLFSTVEGEQVSENGMKHAIAKYNKKRGVDKTSIHAMRHTFATDYIKGGGSTGKLKTLLGHKSDAITNRYIHITGMDCANEIEKTSLITKLGTNGKKRLVRQ